MTHVGLHWSRTSCLCSCHWNMDGHDDKDCAKLVASEHKALAAQTPVTAVAASHIGFRTPLGYTSRFTR